MTFLAHSKQESVWQPLPWVTSLILYLKSLLPQVHVMSSRVKDWFERSMITSMALDFSRTIWSSAARSLGRGKRVM